MTNDNVKYRGRITRELDKLFFPVGLHSLYFSIDRNASPMEPTMFLGIAPKFRGVIDEESNHMFSCVTRSYHLITNKDAYEMGRMVASIIFGDELLRYADIHGFVSKDGGYCYIFIKFEKVLHIKETQHCWKAFLRITNSYDKTKALSYELGFELETMNEQKIPIGLLIPSLSLNFSVNHIWKPDTIVKKLSEAANRQYQGRNVFADFEHMVDELLQIPIVDDEILALFCRLANIKKLDTANPKDVVLAKLLYQLETTSKKWICKCGNNAYAALCTYAEFIINEYMEYSFRDDNFAHYSVLGRFMEELIMAARKHDFTLYDFIGKDASEARKSIKLIVGK